MTGWALLRLSFDGRANAGSYRQFGACLNLNAALNKRLAVARRPVLSTYIIRSRQPENSYLYEAVIAANAAAERHATCAR